MEGHVSAPTSPVLAWSPNGRRLALCFFFFFFSFFSSGYAGP